MISKFVWMMQSVKTLLEILLKD